MRALRQIISHVLIGSGPTLLGLDEAGQLWRGVIGEDKGVPITIRWVQITELGQPDAK